MNQSIKNDITMFLDSESQPACHGQRAGCWQLSSPPSTDVNKAEVTDVAYLDSQTYEKCYGKLPRTSPDQLQALAGKAEPWDNLQKICKFYVMKNLHILSSNHAKSKIKTVRPNVKTSSPHECCPVIVGSGATKCC